MPRHHTDSHEQLAQKEDLVTRVAGELGVDTVTIAVAQEHRRKSRSVTDITERDIDLSDADLEPIGVLLGRVDDFKIIRGTTAQLSITTNAREFGPLLLEAAQTSYTDLIVCAMFRVPRSLGLDDDDDEQPAPRKTTGPRKPPHARKGGRAQPLIGKRAKPTRLVGPD